MDELLGDFLEETNESIVALDQDIIDFEKDASNKDLLNNIFRVFHTIKGTSGFLDLHRLGKVAHSAENLISSFRDKGLGISPERISLVLDAIDRIKFLLETIGELGKEPEGTDDDVIAPLRVECEKADAADKVKPVAPEMPADSAKLVENKAPEELPVEDNKLEELPVEDNKLEELPVEDNKLDALPAEDDTSEEPEVLKGSQLESYIDQLFDNNDEKSATKEDTSEIVDHADNLSNIDSYTSSIGELSEDHKLEEPAKEESGQAESLDDDFSQMAIDFGSKIISGLEDDELYKDLSGHLDVNDSNNPPPSSPPPQKTQLAEQEVASSPSQEVSVASNSAPSLYGGGLESKKNEESLKPREASQTLKVKVDLLESITNVVSELVLARNQLIQLSRDKPHPDYSPSLQQLNSITSELQEGILKTRMQPIGVAWAKLPRIMRTLCRDLGKQIELRMIGEDTEIDRQVVEYVRDPMVHLVRNCADHGIESPAERKAVSKPETGTIALKAMNEGGQIIIEIADDGKGINFEAIKEKAVQNGEIDPAEAESMSPSQLTQLLFRPGFSTSHNVTSVSGRGVGLDVVRTNLDKIGGNVEVSTVEGQGTTITIKIPLSLSIISGMIVGCKGYKFALPQIVVKEVVSVGEGGQGKIERVQDSPMIDLRGKMLPVVELDRMLKIDGEADNNHPLKHLLVCDSGGTLSGILVDEIFTSEEIVVKQLSSIFQGSSIYSGNTILGDGDIIMILDPYELFIAAGLRGDMAKHSDHNESLNELNNPFFSYLLFGASKNKQKRLISLISVNRIEKIDAAKIDYPAGGAAIQYYGHMMPVVNFDESPLPDEGSLTALIFERNGRHIALIVDDIIDIIDGNFKLDLISPGEKIAGVTVINDHAVDVIDIEYFFNRYLGHAITTSYKNNQLPASGRELMYDILVVMPDPIEHTKLKIFLEKFGAKVFVVGSGRSALLLAQQARKFNAVVVADVLPDMQGVNFAKNLRNRAQWVHVPIVIMSNDKNIAIHNSNKQRFAHFVQDRNFEAMVQTLLNALNPNMRSLPVASEALPNKSLPILTLT